MIPATNEESLFSGPEPTALLPYWRGFSETQCKESLCGLRTEATMHIL